MRKKSRESKREKISLEIEAQIQDEIRRRVFAKEQALQEKREQESHTQASLQALEDVTKLSQEELAQVAQEVRDEYRQKYERKIARQRILRRGIVVGFIGGMLLLLLIGGWQYYQSRKYAQISVKGIFTTGVNANNEPVNNLTEVSLTDRIIFYMSWHSLPKGKYRCQRRIFDGSGMLIKSDEMTFKGEGEHNTWFKYKPRKSFDAPGKWKFEGYLDGKKMLEAYLTVLSSEESVVVTERDKTVDSFDIRPQGPDDKVILYAQGDCEKCQTLSTELKEVGITFTETDTAGDEKAMGELMQKCIFNGIAMEKLRFPVVDVNGKILPNGPSVAEITQYFKGWQGMGSQKDFQKKKFAWLVRRTVDVYDRTARKTSNWDTMAKQFLLDVCKFETEQVSTPTLPELDTQGKTLVNAGCDDPLILLWYGKILHRQHKFEEAEQFLVRAYEGLQQGEYPHVQAFFSTDALAGNLMKQGRDEAGKHWYMLELNALSEAIISKEFNRSESPIAFRLAYNIYCNPYDISKYGHIYNIIKESRDIDPWLLHIVEGESELDAAWKARGSGLASSVTKEGWKGFREHLTRAHANFLEAWQLHPEYPEAAAQMITVIMGGYAESDETERLWFERAIQAQIDYVPAYENYIHALKPLWGGSHEAMYELGMECLNTERFDTDVPMFYLRALREIGGDLPKNRWRAVFRRPGVYENLQQLFNGMLKETGRYEDRKRLLTQRALTEMWCGHYEKAKAMLEEIGEDVDLRKGFWGKALSWSGRGREVIEAELRAFTGPYKDLLQQAESLHLTGQTSEAIPLFEQAMNAHKDDEEIFAYLRREIGVLQMGYSAKSLYSDWSALHFAARGNHIEAAQFLIAHGEAVDSSNDEGQTPLHKAAYYGYQKMVELLLIHEANINATDNNHKTPLHVAIVQNHPEVAQFFVEKGANLNAQTQEGWTPLQLAIFYQQPELARLIIQQDADIHIANTKQWTALSVALRHDQPEIARLLIEKGADINVKTDEYWTPLHLALHYKHPELAEILIQKGADIQARNHQQATPLILAANSGYPELVKLLLAQGADIEAKIKEDQRTVLHVAVQNNQLELVKLLLEKGADVNVREHQGWTPLHLAAYYGHTDIVKLLLKYGADRKAQLMDGATPIEVAKDEKHSEIIKLLSQ